MGGTYNMNGRNKKFVHNLNAKRPLGRQRRVWDEYTNMKMDLLI
jgi:hypothetical protein